jgi:bisphosphoglycerate-dependent phosphoglycerate mutase
MGFDLRLIIQNMKNISEIDVNKVALQIHIALKYNTSKHIFYRYKSLNRSLEIFQCSRQYRKIN